jgi:dihydrofolate synthase/folylpolyglutamate synthase
MNYAEALAHLHALGPELPPSSSADASTSRRKFDLAHMRALCAALGNPHQRVPSVLIAGTNGKGSTAATLASILTAAGYRTGLYTSPHLTRVNERIQLAHPTLPSEYGNLTTHGADGALTLTPIADEDFARLYTLIENTAAQLVALGDLPHPPSFFERLTAVAFAYFAGTDSQVVDSEDPEPRADILVLEVGLGGRLDATNIVDPLVSVLTDIALDHQDYLGDTITAIAREKCGILRPNGTLVTLSQHPEANQVIGEVAAALNVRGVNAAPYLPPATRNTPYGEAASRQAWQDTLRNRYTLSVEDETEPGPLEIDSPLFGSHQQRNLALAIATAIELRNNAGYNITNSAISQGIRATSWPGRLEFFTPNLLLDVAHNPAGAWTLRAAIAALPEAQPRTLLFSCLRDKDLAEMSRILFPLFDSSPGADPLRRHDHIVLAPIPNPRAASVDALLAAAHALSIPAHAAPHLEGALAQARGITPPDGIILATGSVYLIGALRELALHPAEVLA